MSYSILIKRHSGQGLIGNSSAPTEYGSPMVTAAANPGGHFVCFNHARRPLAPPSLPLLAASAKPLGAATGTRTQGRVHGQSAPSANSSRPDSLSPAAAA